MAGKVRTVENYITHRKYHKDVSSHRVDVCNSGIFCGTCLFQGACNEMYQSEDSDSEHMVLLST